MRSVGAPLDAAPWALTFRLLQPPPEPPQRLLLLLHGFGADEMQLAGLAARVDPATLVVLPRAPRTVSGGGHGWFRVDFGGDEPQALADEAEQSRRRLLEFIDQLQHRHAVPPRATVVAGFSQGGVLAASAALTAPGCMAGFAVLCGRILPEIEAGPVDREAVAALEGLLVHGRDDPVLPLQWADRADRLLRRWRVPHALQVHDGGHALNEAIEATFLAWLGDPARRWNAAPGTPRVAGR